MRLLKFFNTVNMPARESGHHEARLVCCCRAPTQHVYRLLCTGHTCTMQVHSPAPMSFNASIPVEFMACMPGSHSSCQRRLQPGSTLQGAEQTELTTKIRFTGSQRRTVSYTPGRRAGVLVMLSLTVSTVLWCQASFNATRTCLTGLR
jgi:hypothetical protein